MLSRDADSCYWIGRYVERAEATARMVDVHYHASLEAPLRMRMEGESGLQPMQWHTLLEISGSIDRFNNLYANENDRDVVNFFVFDRENPDSILSAWQNARENARSIR